MPSMRIALLSDIHGNAVALDAVLADLAARAVDRILCLGDVAALGPQPREVLARLAQLACPVVMGNTDAWLLDPQLRETADADARRMQEVELWCAQQLSEADRAYIRTFTPTVEAPLASGRTLLGYHGSPRSYDDILLPTTPDDEALTLLAPALADPRVRVLAGGHTHRAMLRRLRGALLLNPGSVGLPFDPVPPPAGAVRNPAWGEYAIVEAGERGALGVELRRVPFDLAALGAVMRSSGMPHAEWLIADWTAEEPAAS